MNDSITISSFDKKRLLGLIEQWEADPQDRGHIDDLAWELERAIVVEPQAMPADVVTMNSRLRLTDVDTGEQRTITVVFPGMANTAEGKISILAPLGTALLGYRVGELVEWNVPSGLRRLRVDAIEYQPEAAGDFRL
ncbi:MAG TPA: nucleoside diphosphate kinase regulator [Thermoanaerobaculia bacterium]